jgi:hypothetical protein
MNVKGLMGGLIALTSLGSIKKSVDKIMSEFRLMQGGTETPITLLPFI